MALSTIYLLVACGLWSRHVVSVPPTPPPITGECIKHTEAERSRPRNLSQSRTFDCVTPTIALLSSWSLPTSPVQPSNLKSIPRAFVRRTCARLSLPYASFAIAEPVSAAHFFAFRARLFPVDFCASVHNIDLRNADERVTPAFPHSTRLFLSYGRWAVRRMERRDFVRLCVANKSRINTVVCDVSHFYCSGNWQMSFRLNKTIIFFRIFVLSSGNCGAWFAMGVRSRNCGSIINVSICPRRKFRH